MKKIIFFLLLCMQFAVQADVIDRNIAKSTACTFLRSECEETCLPADSDIQPNLYIFNSCDSTGFVILSADDCAQGILAFSFNSYFDADKIPDNCRALLKRYSIDIKRAAKRKIRSKFRAPATNTKGMRLVTPEWNQSSFPYNALTPANTHAGCVPAAMGIVMGAWRWPVTGKGNSAHSGTVVDGDMQLPYSFNLDHGINFNLDRLPYKHIHGKTSLEDEESLARLMLHLGVSVQAKYSPGGTSAYTRDACTALIDHFKFDPGAVYDFYLISGTTDYGSILRREINEKRPVICAIPGHAIVCDGVWDNYFHFNFGWGGLSNGYYLLSPSANDSDSGGLFIDELVYGLRPDISCSDYTPRSVEVVYDEAPSESEKPEDITISDKYSPVELCSDGGKWTGIASPFDSYPKGSNARIYVSGLKLTGRFDGSTETLDKTSWQSFNIAIGVVDKDENIRAVYPHYSSVQVNYNFTTSGIYTLELSPNIEITPADKIVVLMRRNSDSDWKIVKGVSDVSSELKTTQPSSEYLPFSLKYNSTDFRINKPWGQLENKVVKGQRYTLYVYPLKQMSSIDVKVNGKSTDFMITNTDSDDTYYTIIEDLIDHENFNITIDALSGSQTDITVNLTEPGTLAEKLGGHEGQIRSLTITGKMNAIDMRHISTDLFPMLNTLNLSDAEITDCLSIFPSGTIIEEMLYRHDNIEEVKLPRTLTQIMDRAFYSCWQLKRISIPEGVSYIPNQAFGSNAYEEVTNYSTKPQSINEYFVDRLNSNSTLLVPYGSKAAYESHPLWSRFSTIKEFDPSGIPNIPIDDTNRSINVYFTSEGHLTIDGIDRAVPVKIYDFTGKAIWSGSSDNVSTVSLHGACIVLVEGRAFKIMH